MVLGVRRLGRLRAGATMTSVLRSVTFSVAISVLAAACALVEQPPPPGTRPIDARVHNGASQPAEITLTLPTGVLPDAVRPSVVEPGTTADVTIHLPASGAWTIVINEYSEFDGTRIADLISAERTIGIEIVTVPAVDVRA